MLDFLHFMLCGRMAKMDVRGATAVEYGVLIAGILFVLAGLLVHFSRT
jgi:pilus assembly protein Flp/PilA